jgi:hypothetical protein
MHLVKPSFLAALLLSGCATMTASAAPGAPSVGTTANGTPIFVGGGGNNRGNGIGNGNGGVGNFNGGIGNFNGGNSGIGNGIGNGHHHHHGGAPK